MTAVINLVARCREKPTRAGYVYEVLKDGKVLLASLNPEFAACRLLASEGVIGKARFWREGQTAHDTSSTYSAPRNSPSGRTNETDRAL